jgi:hypothetical protein
MSKVDCPECRGYGETAVPGTYGPTISRERLELVRCWLCEGTGVVDQSRIDEYEGAADDDD